MSQIITFFSLTGTDSEGRTLTEILAKDDVWWETTNDFIQWVLPTNEEPHFGNAPVLTQTEIDLLRGQCQHTGVGGNFVAVIDRVLQFFGLVIDWSDEGLFCAIIPGVNFEVRKHTWQQEPNQFHVYMTRFLKCLTLLKYDDIRLGLLEYLETHPVNPDSLRVWKQVTQG